MVQPRSQTDLRLNVRRRHFNRPMQPSVCWNFCTSYCSAHFIQSNKRTKHFIVFLCSIMWNGVSNVWGLCCDFHRCCFMFLFHYEILRALRKYELFTVLQIKRLQGTGAGTVCATWLLRWTSHLQRLNVMKRFPPDASGWYCLSLLQV